MTHKLALEDNNLRTALHRLGWWRPDFRFQFSGISYWSK